MQVFKIMFVFKKIISTEIDNTNNSLDFTECWNTYCVKSIDDYLLRRNNYEIDKVRKSSNLPEYVKKFISESHQKRLCERLNRNSKLAKSINKICRSKIHQ
ncbi:hypothetical protein LUQ84_000939 [Hamiltosporidium tvaerminnensis]|nr:hypothetical protein LUQ84_000939 [Hamiltosporidium tvaerminnensis]